MVNIWSTDTLLYLLCPRPICDWGGRWLLQDQVLCFQLLTSVPLHGFQRSTAAALCDLTTEVLRTINATENAMVEYGLSEPVDRSHLVGTDVKQADDAFRELEENVSLKRELHASLSPNSLCVKVKLSPTLLLRLTHDGNVWTGFKCPGCYVSVSQERVSVQHTHSFNYKIIV